MKRYISKFLYRKLSKREVQKHLRKYWWKHRLLNFYYKLKIKSYCIFFKPFTAYDPNDYEQFSFLGWISLLIDNRFFWFKRWKTKTLEWHVFGWETIFKKKWKYIGPKKKEYHEGWWYGMIWDFRNHIVTVKELPRRPLTEEEKKHLRKLAEDLKSSKIS